MSGPLEPLPIDWPGLWAMAQRGGTGWPDGLIHPRESEHDELIRLRAEVRSLSNRVGAAVAWMPGMPKPEGVDVDMAEVEADYQAEMHLVARKQQQAEDARRMRDAQGWQPPLTEPLAAELARPRATYRHRIEGLAGWNHNVLIAGERKVGKSTLMINLSAALSLSRWERDAAAWTPGLFLGPWTPCRMGGNLAYWNGEMDADDFRDELRRLPPGCYDPARIFALHTRGEKLPVITSEAARAWFVSWLREREIEVLIIDTWGQFLALNGVRRPQDDGEVRPVLDGLDQIKRDTWVRSLLVPIHMPHQTGERHLERFKGAGAVGDWADTLWTYVKDESETRYLWAEGRARVQWRETALAWTPETGQLWWGQGGSRAQTARERQREKALAALKGAGAGGLGAEELKEAAGGNRKAAGELLAELTRDGLAEIEKKGRAKIYRMKDYRQDQAQDQSDHGDE